MENKSRKLLSTLLILSIFILPIPIPLIAQAENTANDLSMTRQYGSNGGFLMPINTPESDSIPISTRADLEAINNNLSGNYHLVNNLDLSDAKWEPIGDNNNPFTGTFDGQGYVIQNMETVGDWVYSGLFGYVDTGNIKNVGLHEKRMKEFPTLGVRKL